MNLLSHKNRKNERGSVLAVSAIGMLALLLAVGLGVDISHLYLAKNELQNAADAAALAGASGLNYDDSGIGYAADRAVKEMNKYEFNQQAVSFPRANVVFAANLNGPYMDELSAKGVASTIRFVQVTTQQSPVGISFVSNVLGKTFNLKAEATAGVSVALTGFTGYLPVSVVDDDNLSTIKPGQLYTFRGAPQGSVSPGNYQILAIDGSGASDDRIGLASGVKNVVGAGGYVDTKPGVSAGAVRQGINTRFDDYASGLDPSTFPPDTNIKEGINYQTYQDGSQTQPPSHEGVADRRVVLIPIVKKSQFDGGRTRVQIDHFGAFFLRSKVQGGNGGDIQAEYIGVGVVVGGGVYDPGAAAGPGPVITKPVLYR
ncbi:MAG TPA: pilus assembly protein TadG-related protein [Pyrinomonadaceae bacterium]|nr:pilus assembly protein TadG-related protein [Pyrinomonadaceae bacterium]